MEGSIRKSLYPGRILGNARIWGCADFTEISGNILNSIIINVHASDTIWKKSVKEIIFNIGLMFSSGSVGGERVYLASLLGFIESVETCFLA